ncbi:MAG: hypothetical protein WC374_09145 [Phycisphaerae bacterium]|jgi:hypothetical protein
MRSAALILIIVLSVFVLAGCAVNQIVPEPAGVTFEDAMKQVADGINEMYDSGQGRPKTGLVPTEVTIDFNISVSGSDSGHLLVKPVDNLQVVSGEAGVESQIAAARGNKITIKFTNLFLNESKDSMIMTKSPEEIVKLLTILEKAGYTPVIRILPEEE